MIFSRAFLRGERHESEIAKCEFESEDIIGYNYQVGTGRQLCHRFERVRNLVLNLRLVRATEKFN